MTRRILVLPSPLLGPATYAPLAASLSGHGSPAEVASLPEGEVTPDRVLATFRAQAAAVGATVLVAHSNAGYYAPAVAAEGGLTTIFMDASLPAPDAATTLLAPPAFAEFIDALPLQDGLLPPWPSWWEREEIVELFPDQDWLDRATRQAPRLPPRYFRTPVPVPDGWADRPAAYLAFGDTYAAELALAERSGWEVRRDDGHHLQHLTRPDHVAELLLDLLERCLERADGSNGSAGRTVPPVPPGRS